MISSDFAGLAPTMKSSLATGGKEEQIAAERHWVGRTDARRSAATALVSRDAVEVYQ